MQSAATGGSRAAAAVAPPDVAALPLSGSDGAARRGLSLGEAVKTADALRARGNAKFRTGTTFAAHTLGRNSMVEACSEYALALETLKVYEAEQPGATANSAELQGALVAVLLNLAAAGLALDSWDSARNCCNEVLRLQPGNAKALFRRARAAAGEGRLVEALDDLAQAARHEPASAEIRAESRRVKDRLAADEAAAAFRRETEEGLARMQLREMSKRHAADAGSGAGASAGDPAAPGLALAAGAATAKDIATATATATSSGSSSSLSPPGSTPAAFSIPSVPPPTAPASASAPAPAPAPAPVAAPAPAPASAPASEPASAEPLSAERLQSLGLSSYLSNGAVLAAYAWGQTLNELHVLVAVPPAVRARDIAVDVHRRSLHAKARGETLLLKEPTFPLDVDECTWELEEGGVLHLVLRKQHAARTIAPGFEWWPAPFSGDPPIDVQSCSVPNGDLRQLPERQKREMAHAIWEGEQQRAKLSAEERRELDSHSATAHAEQRRAEEATRKAMQNPNKKALYEMMRDKFPDVAVEFR